MPTFKGLAGHALTALLAVALAACGSGLSGGAANGTASAKSEHSSSGHGGGGEHGGGGSGGSGGGSGGGGTTASSPVVVAWNDLGMHCMDGKDYSVFSILPPYNNLHAQLVDRATGQLVQGAVLTYESIPDPATGGINTTSATKTNFWDYVLSLYGVSVPPDMGLAGFPMASTTPAPLKFNTAQSWYEAEAIPMTPYEDGTLQKNYYPMVRVTARDAKGNAMASSDVVLPVSDELSCRTCHASNSDAAARPATGWVNNANSELDWKQNILALHDQKFGADTAFLSAFATLKEKGALTGATLSNSAAQGKPVLCAACHGSNALPGTGVTGIEPLTVAIHSLHAKVNDPATGTSLNDENNRDTCYLCHPGSTTQCLRGAMGSATATDGSALMQCQSCHGKMSAVGAASRAGWLDEPNCQSCHHDGLRQTSALGSDGQPLPASAIADTRFATNPNKPMAGYSLFRFSTGHGSLQCEACHGATHAIYPSTHNNDNVENVALQGHAGTLAECTVCHSTVPLTANGGPHGMHTVGSSWVSAHHDMIGAAGGTSSCAACHGADYRGSDLSKVTAARSFSTEHGTKTYAAGDIVGCYDCHNGPNDD